MKKVLAVMLAAATMTIALGSCSAKPSSKTASAETSGAGVTTLNVGMEAAYPPMEFQDNKGNAIGFDVDMANAIGKKLGIAVKFTNINWDGIFLGLSSKKYDCIISAVSITPEREKNYIFTKPYVSNAQMIVVKPGDTSISKPEDLKGKKVGCQVGTTAEDSAKTLKKTISFSLRTYPQVMSPFLDLKTGSVNAVVVDEVVGNYYIAQDKKDYAAAAAKLTNEPIGICFRKDETTLRDKVQGALDQMAADGTMKSISVKWFGKDLTSNIDPTFKSIS